jgi:hypothetical protein
MKKSVPFNFFQEGQEIYFDIDRFEELEKLTGKTTGEIINSSLSISLLYALLIVGLRHHNPAGSRELYKSKITETGVAPILLWQAAVKAIMVSGLFGVQIADAVLEDKPLPETDEKNV